MNAFSRCRPLLGTYVTISITGNARGRAVSEACAALAVESAFARIAAVSARLSFHDVNSELSRFNRQPLNEAMEGSPELRDVLRAAAKLQRASGGVYSVAVGGPLVNAGILPGARTRTSWRAIRAVPFSIRGSRVTRRKPVAIDLGGIAKGYAVDRAAETLKGFSGVVNAGGDLRVFGNQSQKVLIRDAQGPVGGLLIRRGAVATSTILPGTSAYIDIPGRRVLRTRSARTAFVTASTCMMADALTKVALLAPRRLADRIAVRERAKIGRIGYA